jgi:hypothetical protein
VIVALSLVPCRRCDSRDGVLPDQEHGWLCVDCASDLTIEAARMEALVHGCGRCHRINVGPWRYVAEGEDKLIAICAGCVTPEDRVLHVDVG